MTPAGWIFMFASCFFVLGLTIYCYARVLRAPRTTEHMHAPLDIDTQDRDT